MKQRKRASAKSGSHKRVYVRAGLLTAAVLLVLLIVGTMADLPISKALYPGHETSLGQFFAAFGELPAFLGLTCAGLLAVVNRNRLHPQRGLLYGICGALLLVLGLGLMVREAVDNVPALPVWVALLVAVFASLVAGLGVVLLARNCPVKTIVRFVLTLVFVTIGVMALVNIIKVPWGRARMRLIDATGNDGYFTPWYQAGSALKNQLVVQGVPKDEFRSFPSGHMACASCALLAVLLPTLNPRWKDRERVCLLVGAAWALAVAVSRIWMGAHFLSDVAVSGLIALGMSALGIYLFYFNKKVFGFFWRLLADKAINQPE